MRRQVSGQWIREGAPESGGRRAGAPAAEEARGGLAGWQPTALFQSVQAVVEKPRTFYVLTGGPIGAPVFDLRGQFIGIVLRFKNEADAANAPPIVLPAADIREVAKQAT